MTNHIEVCCANQKSYTTLVQETGVSGTISGVGISGGRDEHYFRIEVDGTVVHDGYNPSQAQVIGGSTLTNYFTCSNGTQETNNGLTLEFPFEDNFTVDIRDGANQYVTPRFWTSYRLNIDSDSEDEESSGEESQDEPDREEITEEANLVFLEQEFASGRSRKALIGNKVHAVVELEQDTYQIGDIIEPQIRFKRFDGESAPLEPALESEASLRMQAFGRTHALESEPLSEADVNGDALTLAKELEYRGEFELVTGFENIGNHPTTFTVL